MSLGTPEQLAMARASGRSTGALFFSVFGGCWLCLALVYSHHFHWYAVLPIAAVVLGFILIARSVKREVGNRADCAYPEAEKKANDRRFLILNAYTYGAVFLLFAILPRFGLSNYVFPAFVFVVGLHFLPMPPLYRHRANTVVGLLMMAWAVACVALFHHNGELEAVCVTGGAGVLLWGAAAFALTTASSLLHQYAQ